MRLTIVCVLALWMGFHGPTASAADTKEDTNVDKTYGAEMSLEDLLTVVVTLAGTGGARWTYARVAKRGSRPIDDES